MNGHTPPPSPFAGFWMGGFEGADHVNGHGQALDMALASGHVQRLDEDHRRAAQAGLRVVRESIGWRLSEAAGGDIDLSRALRIQASARRHGLQPLWTLMHYGLPSDLSLHDDAMVPRLVRFAREVARVLGRRSDTPPVYTVVNEIGFLAWAATGTGLLCPPPAPASTDAEDPGASQARELSRGYEVKCRLARAALLAMRAMREEDPRARFLNVEPLVHVTVPPGRTDLQPRAAQEHGWQWQAWDMLAGHLEPQLGGGAEWLDLVGVNHYHSGQWEVQTQERLHWHLRDPRRVPLHRLLQDTWQRYRAPLIVAETSHVGIGRAPWLHEVAAEVRTAQRHGLPVLGLCLYPLVDRPDWQVPTQWHRSGVWHVDVRLPPTPPDSDGAAATPALQRHAEPAVLAALRAWQAHLPPAAVPHGGHASGPPQRILLVYAQRRWLAHPQRTRQLLEGLTQAPGGWRVVLVEVAEEPDVREGSDAGGRLDRSTPGAGSWLDHQVAGPGFDVLVPHGFGPRRQHAQWTRRLSAALADWWTVQGLREHLAWLDTPLAWPLARALGPVHVVVDAADSGAWSAGGLPLAAALQADMLAHAGLLLTAVAPAPPDLVQGLSSARVECVPDGVDLARFNRRAGLPGCWTWGEARALMPALSGCVLGYAGPIDERLDLGLIAALARARPDWHWVLVGPLRGLCAADLPRAGNLHWVDEVPQALLPAIMCAWQACVLPRKAEAGESADGLSNAPAPAPALASVPALMPVAMPSAMPSAISEALALGLAVITTLPSSAAWRRAGVRAASGQEAFMQACEEVLAEDAPCRRQRRRHARQVLLPHAFHHSAARCERLLRQLLDSGPPAQPVRVLTAADSAPGRAPDRAPDSAPDSAPDRATDHQALQQAEAVGQALS